MKLRHVYSTADLDSAQRVLQAARSAGIDNDALSLIARSDIELQEVPDERKDVKTDFLPAAARGAATGGAAGLVAGLVAIAVPPIGLTLAGAGVMALAGALVGSWSSALIGATVPDPVRRQFEDQIQAGRVLVIIDAEQAALQDAEAAMVAAGATPLPYRPRRPPEATAQGPSRPCNAAAMTRQKAWPMPLFRTCRVDALLTCPGNEINGIRPRVARTSTTETGMNVPYQIPGRAPDEDRSHNVSTYWRERFTEEPYYTEGDRYEDYEGAYLAGHEARIRDNARAYDQVEAELHRDWEAKRGTSSLSWSKARHAVKRAWENAADFVTGDDAHKR